MSVTIPPISDHTARLRAKLLHRIKRRYAVVSQSMTLGQLRLEFTRIANPDLVLDEVARQEDQREKASGQRRQGDELHLPYWAELWDSATGVGQFLAGGAFAWLLGNRPEGSQPQVLDLGCGMGLTGTVAAALGAQVIFADLESSALLLAGLNSLPWSKQVYLRRMNWRTDDLARRFDLIIGADILYERAQWEYLDVCWRRHLSPGGHILLGEPGRQTGDLFIDWIVRNGWSLQQFEQPVSTRPRPIRLFVLTKK